jgi:hypothetical protein
VKRIGFSAAGKCRGKNGSLSQDDSLAETDCTHRLPASPLRIIRPGPLADVLFVHHLPGRMKNQVPVSLELLPSACANSLVKFFFKKMFGRNTNETNRIAIQIVIDTYFSIGIPSLEERLAHLLPCCSGNPGAAFCSALLYSCPLR